MESKVVITAASAITPIGNDMKTITNNLKSGYCGIDYIKRYNMEQFAVKHAGEIDTEILSSISYPLEANLQFKFFYYCMHKLFHGMDLPYKQERMGCILGTDPNTGTVEDFDKLLMDYVNVKNRKSDLFESTITANHNMHINPSLLLYYSARDFCIQGANFCSLGTCAASTQAIGLGYRLLKENQTDSVVVGGISCKIDPISISRLCRLEALAKTKGNVKEICKPFDKERSGFTMSEGCVLFLIEREKDALKRNADILGEIKGFGAALDGFSMTDPHNNALGMQLAMERALKNANLKLEDIDYINAHGTSTVKNDMYETMAIKNIFKEKAYALDISSTKSMHGHLMTATGAMEVLCCLIAINEEFVPPTINYFNKDKNCDLYYVPNKSKQKHLRYCLSNNFGLGGQNASLVIARYN